MIKTIFEPKMFKKLFLGFYSGLASNYASNRIILEPFFTDPGYKVDEVRGLFVRWSIDVKEIFAA